MSISVKSLMKAVKAVEKSSSPAPSKSQKRNAKRKQKRQQAAQAVPGTSVMRATQSQRSFEVKFSHKEWLSEIQTGDDGKLQGSVYIAPNQITWLAGVAKNFEKYRWTKFEVEYIPDVGTTKDGSVAVGVDYGTSEAKLGSNLLGSDKPTSTKTYTKASVMALTPSLVTPLWQGARLVVPTQVLQTRKWYDSPSATSTSIADYGPGFIAYYVNAPAKTVVGDVWVSYSITFAGTRQVA